MTLQVNHENQPREFLRKVFYTGNDAVLKGIGLVYDYAFAGTGSGEAAADAYGKRDKAVKKVAGSTLPFAGVSKEYYPAKTGGQWIFISEPGGCAEALVTKQINTVAGTTYLVFSKSTGLLIAPSATREEGRGVALALQTITGDQDDPTMILVKLEDGLDAVLK